MASVKSSLLLASLASLSLATPLHEKQSTRAQLLPYYRGHPHKYPSLQCAATGQRGRVLDEEICGTWFFCHYTWNADTYELGHDQSYPTMEACLDARERAPDGQKTPVEPKEGLIPWMEQGAKSTGGCDQFGLGVTSMFFCGTNEYCDKFVKKTHKPREECLALFEKRPESPKSDAKFFTEKDDSEPRPVWN